MHIYKLCICITILIILSILWYIINRLTEPFRVFQKCEYEHYVMTEEDIKLSYELMQDVSHAFNKHGVQYFMIGGTLLGSIRHGGIIPWDDDMDIAIIDTDIEKMHLALNELVERGKITYSDIFFGLKIFSVNKAQYPFIDVFYYTKEGDKYIFKHKEARDKWSKEWFHESEVFPLQKGKFGSLQLNTPYTTLPYVERVFGTTWNTEYKGVHVYKPGATINLTEGKLTDDMLCHF